MALFPSLAGLGRRPAALESAGLGATLVALRLDGGQRVHIPASCLLVVFDAGGRARRGVAATAAGAAGEIAYCFHPGPYRVDLAPFAAAPELGLRLQLAVDAPDPRVPQQRFDLFLFSEGEARLTLEQLAAALQAALRLELEQGNLELPPCTSPDEWHVFRAGLNQLLYTRFGLSVDDCLPVDLAGRVDFAQMLETRALAPPLPAAPSSPAAPARETQEAQETASAPAPLSAADDGRALRRLFLELPALGAGLRQLTLPPGQDIFQAWRALLQRLDLAAVDVAALPSLAWLAPDRPLPAREQARRAAASAAATRALDEAWALLARWRAGAAAPAALLDEGDRICSNLEQALALRRATRLPDPQPGQGDETP